MGGTRQPANGFKMNLYTRVKFAFLTLIILAAVSTEDGRAQVSPRLYAVELEVAAESSPPVITLGWNGAADAVEYILSRRLSPEESWTEIARFSAGAGSYNFSDTNVSAGVVYEYQVLKPSTGGYLGTGQVLAGVEIPAVEQRGKVLLVVDQAHSTALAGELERLRMDLIGDGWMVIRENVSPAWGAPAVKEVIQGHYNVDPAAMKAVFLVGHVAVPYSGDYDADWHADHRGAWPADSYYADMDGVWTDSTVTSTGANKAWNHNIPGDGKFDQTEIPSDLELQVGRVDLSNLTCYANKVPARSEVDLLRNYLEKNHRWRHGMNPLPRRGFIIDTFGDIDQEAYAANGWRNFSSMFGIGNVVEGEPGTFFSTLATEGYGWAYGSGGGGWSHCDPIGTSDDFALNDPKVAFTGFFGSYFGDWDNESNFLRAGLASGTHTVATAWMGRPHWFFHRMGLGETIGFSLLQAQNNGAEGPYEPVNWGTRQVHVSLLGDPTLRMHPVIPASNVTLEVGTGEVVLNWDASTDTNIVSYFIYRAGTLAEPFERVGETSTTTFSDPAGTTTDRYMIRALKLETTPTGSYYNLSQGVFTEGVIEEPEEPASTAEWVGLDDGTGGTWEGTYGAQGYNVIRDIASYPAHVNVAASGQSEWVWNWTTADMAAVQRASDNTRLAACWYSFSPFEVRLDFKDEAAHRVRFYCLDWDLANREQIVEIFDSASGELLSRQAISGFGDGVYLTWDLQGSVTARFTPVSGNAVLSGIFFDSPLPTVETPTFTPPAGSYEETATVSIDDATPGAVVRYTLDGSTPTGSSPLYTSPLVLTNTTAVRARGFKEGMVDSAVATAVYTITYPSGPPAATVAFGGIDIATQGNWKGAYGSGGYQVIGDSQSIPAGITMSTSGKSDWLWEYSTADARALQRTAQDSRLAACWYASGSFEIDLDAASETAVSLYCVDWDNGGRKQTVEVYDQVTGTLMLSQELQNFSGGIYLNYTISGRVVIKFTKVQSYNAVVSGIFFD